MLADEGWAACNDEGRWEEAKTADLWMGGSGLEKNAECEERANHKKNCRLAAGSHDPQTCLPAVDIEGRSN